MSGAPLLIHVGYHKTATTWLQNVLFRQRNGFVQILDHAEIFAHLVMPHGLDFDADPAAALIAERRGAGPVDVISLEALCGNPFYGGRESEVYAQRLATVAPQARIVLGIREQSRMVASVYMQYLQRGGTLSAQQFMQGTAEGGYFGFDPAHFRYHRLVELYQSLFGAENVLALPLEQIAADQCRAVETVCAFAGHPGLPDWRPDHARGVSYPETVAPVLRRLNHLRGGPAHPGPVADLGGAAQFAYRVAGGLANRLHRGGRPVTDLANSLFGAAYYGESNRRLAERAAHPLDLSGYPGLPSRAP